MAIPPAIAIAAVLILEVRGGHGGTGGGVPRGLSLVVLGVFLQVLRLVVLTEDWTRDPSVGRAFGACTLAIGIALIILNRPARAVSHVQAYGVWTVSAGIISNAIPVVLVGAMPFSVSAATAAGYDLGGGQPPPVGYVAADSVNPITAAFGDFIPLPALMKVLSVGDLLLMVGIVIVLVTVLLPGRTATGPVHRWSSHPSTKGGAQ